MPSLKDFRLRIASVKSTQKITSAMKMVAASKLKRAQAAAEAGRPYAERMERMLGELVGGLPTSDGAPALLAGTGKENTVLLLAVTADRGLSGGFNSNVVREVRKRTKALEADGKTVKILCVGRKGRDGLKRDLASRIVATHEQLMRAGAQFDVARKVADELVTRFEAGEFDACEVVYNQFKSVISQVVTVQRLIPFPAPARQEDAGAALRAQHILEPSEEEILAELLPRNLAVQVYRAFLESFASEQGARMTAMDNATRNAGDMIDSLTLRYNRTRQAYITKELIEIISGAEAL